MLGELGLQLERTQGGVPSLSLLKMTDRNTPRIARVVAVWVAAIAVGWAALLGVLHLAGVW